MPNHAHVIQFFKDLGECPLARIADVQQTWRGTTALEPMIWERDDPHPLLKIADERTWTEPCDAEFFQHFDPRAHEWSIWAMRREDSPHPMVDADEWAEAWRVKAETRDEALELALIAHIDDEIKAAILGEIDRQIAANVPNCGEAATL